MRLYRFTRNIPARTVIHPTHHHNIKHKCNILSFESSLHYSLSVKKQLPHEMMYEAMKVVHL